MHVSLRVLLASQKLLHFVISQFFTQRGEQVSELSRADVAIAVLVKVAQALNEVLGRVCAAVLADGLQDRQEHVKADPLIGPELVAALLHVSLSGVLAEGAKHIAELGDVDLAIAAVVKQREGLLVVYAATKTTTVKRC